MWLICESTSDPRVLKTLLVSDGEAWIKTEDETPGPTAVQIPSEKVKSEWAHVKWLVSVAPSSARGAETGWRVHTTERLSEFVWPREMNMPEAEWFDRLASRSLEISGAHDCPAYCHWPGRPDIYLGPLVFPALPAGSARGPSEEGPAAIVTVPMRDLTEVEWGGSTRSILRPGRTPTVIDYHFVGPIPGLARDVARLLREWSSAPPHRGLEDAISILGDLGEEFREPLSIRETAKVSTVLKAIDRLASDNQAMSDLAGALLDHVSVKARLEERLNEFQQQRETELEAQLWSELQDREEELDRELDAKREELAANEAALERIKEEITRLREEAGAVQDELIEATRRSIANLRNHGVSALSNTLMVDSLLRAHSATPPVPAAPAEPKPPKDVHELLYRGSASCEEEGQREVVRLGVAAALHGTILVLGGPNAEGWGDFFARLLGGSNTWKVWCRADVFGLEDLLKSPSLRTSDGTSARLGRALAHKSILSAVPALHLMGLGNAPWSTGASALLRSLAFSQQIGWTPAQDLPVETFTPANAIVVVSLGQGELSFPVDRSLSGLVAMWYPDVSAPQAGPEFDLSASFIREALAEMSRRANDQWSSELTGLEGGRRAEATVWLAALAAGSTDVDVSRLLAIWAASRGGLLGRPTDGLSDQVIEEMQMIIQATPSEVTK